MGADLPSVEPSVASVLEAVTPVGEAEALAVLHVLFVVAEAVLDILGDLLGDGVQLTAVVAGGSRRLDDDGQTALVGLEDTAGRLTVIGEPDASDVLREFATDGVLAVGTLASCQNSLVEAALAGLLDVRRDDQRTQVVLTAALAVEFDRLDLLSGRDGRMLGQALSPVALDLAAREVAGVEVVALRHFVGPEDRLRGTTGRCSAVAVGRAAARSREHQNRNGRNGQGGGHATRSHLFCSL